MCTSKSEILEGKFVCPDRRLLTSKQTRHCSFHLENDSVNLFGATLVKTPWNLTFFWLEISFHSEGHDQIKPHEQLGGNGPFQITEPRSFCHSQLDNFVYVYRFTVSLKPAFI